MERCARLAAAIAPWSAMPVGLGFGLSRHQCVFALLRPDPALVRARRLTCEAFAREEATFMPHVSLAYGPIDDAARARIDADRPELPRFACDALALWATGGDEAGWREVGRAALGG